MILLTDTEGVKSKSGELISNIDTGEVQDLIDDETIIGGMIPKITCCLDAVLAGVRKAHIIDSRIEHACLLEIFTDKGIGTQVAGVKLEQP